MTWGDKMEALASYAKQSKDEELMKMATRIRDRAIRRAGELLKQIDGTGNNQHGVRTHTNLSQREVAEQAGMSKHQQVQAVRVANVPAEDLERQVESEKPPTVTKLAQQGTTPAPRAVVDLKGRDPGEFNRSLHFVAEFEDYQRAIEKIYIEAILPGLVETERARVRKAIAAIDAVHDRIITRI